MSASMLAIFGGTFDPVHLGHLRAAWEAAEQLDAEVRMMPARVPPHRAPTVASADERVALLRAALAGQSRLRLDTRELDRDGPSYTVDTLALLRREIGSQRPLLLLVGADAFASLPQWHRGEDLLELAHLGVMTRPGVAARWPESLRRTWAARRADDVAALRSTPAGGILELAVTALDISASAVRACVAAGREPRYLVPEALLADPGLLAPYRRRHG